MLKRDIVGVVAPNVPAAAMAVAAPVPAQAQAQAADAEEERKRRELYERNLLHYRDELAKLQAQAPNGQITDMPGITPEHLGEREKTIVEAIPFINYSKRYNDLRFEYRHVALPKPIARWLPQRLMSEPEWRSFGVVQSPGWHHYMIHEPEPHILLFRRDPEPEPVPEPKQN